MLSAIVVECDGCYGLEAACRTVGTSKIMANSKRQTTSRLQRARVRKAEGLAQRYSPPKLLSIGVERSAVLLASTVTVRLQAGRIPFLNVGEPNVNGEFSARSYSISCDQRIKRYAA